MLFGAAILLIMVFVGHAAMPFFGMFLNGIPGILIYLVMAVLWTYAAWLLYQLDVRGWWLSLIIVAATFVSSMLTYAHHDIIELYQQMGYPQAQIEEIKKLNLMLGSRMGWITALCSLPYLAYLLFIKKYLSGKKPSA